MVAEIRRRLFRRLKQVSLSLVVNRDPANRIIQTGKVQDGDIPEGRRPRDHLFADRWPGAGDLPASTCLKACATRSTIANASNSCRDCSRNARRLPFPETK